MFLFAKRLTGADQDYISLISNSCGIVKQKVFKDAAFSNPGFFKISYDFLNDKGPGFGCDYYLHNECFAGGSHDIEYHPRNLFRL